jgi:hypothetical protein
LSDRFGIQVRGGCACAGTYGHYLLEVSYEKSVAITDKITHGDLSEKPGWVRLSLHPTMTNDEILYFSNALHEIVLHYVNWKKDYTYSNKNNEFKNNRITSPLGNEIEQWFDLNE